MKNKLILEDEEVSDYYELKERFDDLVDERTQERYNDAIFYKNLLYFAFGSICGLIIFAITQATIR